MAYMSVILAGGVFFVSQMALNATLTAQGDSRTYRNMLIGGFVANCGLNPWLMYGGLGVPRMGVAGIALATVLVQLASCVFLHWRIRKTELCKDVPLRGFLPQWEVQRSIAGQAAPAAFNMLTVAMGIFVIIWFVGRFSKEAVAAYGIATRIEQVMLLPTIGLNYAVLAIVGQNFGAGNKQRVRQAWLTSALSGAGLMLLGGVIVWFLRRPAMAMFTTSAEVIERGADYLGVAAITLSAYPLLFCTVFTLQGLKRPAFALWMGLYRQIVAPVLVFHLLAFVFGWQLWGVWWGIFAVTWSGAIFSFWWCNRVCSPV
jgi:putative MATE family efflux protein